MDMMATQRSSDLERIHQVTPELQVSSIRPGEDGLVNDVLIVNEERVFRFADEGRNALELRWAWLRSARAIRPGFSSTWATLATPVGSRAIR